MSATESNERQEACHARTVATVNAIFARRKSAGKPPSRRSAWAVALAAVAYGQASTGKPNDGATRRMLANVLERNPRMENASWTIERIANAARRSVDKQTANDIASLIEANGLRETIIELARMRKSISGLASPAFEESLASLETALSLLEKPRKTA